MYASSTMGDDKLWGLVSIKVETLFVDKVGYNDVIDNFTKQSMCTRRLL